MPFHERWPGVLENGLLAAGFEVRITEDCLNGRRTVWEDPFKPGRNGLAGLGQKIESQSPLSLVIVMLGTNDFQFAHPYNDAWAAAQGVARIVREIRAAPIEPGMPIPPILIICPPPVRNPTGLVGPKFRGADQRNGGMPEAYADVAHELGCAYFNAGDVITVSPVDGVHLDADQHAKLGTALIQPLRQLLGK